MVRERRCSFCNGLGTGVGGVQPRQLRVRYYQPQIETYFFRSISNLLYGNSLITQTPTALNMYNWVRHDASVSKASNFDVTILFHKQYRRSEE